MAAAGSHRQCRAVGGSHRQPMNDTVTHVIKKCNCMSSNIRMKKVCEQCGEVFIAKKTFTRFCSHRCNCKALKDRDRDLKIAEATQASNPKKTVPVVMNGIEKEMINVKQLAASIGLGERTMY